MTSMRDRWIEAYSKTERTLPKPVDPMEMARAREVLYKIKQGLRWNISDHHILVRKDEEGSWHLFIDFSPGSGKRVFGENIAKDLSRLIRNKRSRHRIPQVLDAYAKFGALYKRV